ncbi:MAG: V-type ATP synthase subunit F [Oscillospiraceae bacterium]|nr:V-type ATP synthase subunit F [Oscillospiraceae bacterium]
MKCYLISDNSDTQMGMRLAGIEGTLVHERSETLNALQEAIHRKDIAVVLITEKLAELCGAEIQNLKEQTAQPLLVVIPDRHGTSNMTAAISRYLAETVGIHI